MTRVLLFSFFFLFSFEAIAKIIDINGEDDEYFYFSKEEPICTFDTVYFKLDFYFLAQGKSKVDIPSNVFDEYRFLVVEKKGHVVYHEYFFENRSKTEKEYIVAPIVWNRAKYRSKGSINYYVDKIKVEIQPERVASIPRKLRENLYEIADIKQSDESMFEQFIELYLQLLLKRMGHGNFAVDSPPYKLVRKLSMSLEVEYFNPEDSRDSGWKIYSLEKEFRDEYGVKFLETKDAAFARSLFPFLNNEMLRILDHDSVADEAYKLHEIAVQENLNKTKTWISGFSPGKLNADREIEKVLTIVTESGFGSGCIIGKEGFILTNYHVVAGDSAVHAVFNNGDSVRAEVIKFSPEYDLALLKVDSIFNHGFHIDINKSKPTIGQTVMAIGTPLDLELRQSISKGYISKVRSDDEYPSYQLSISVNPGSSGGALIDNNGELIAIINAKLTGTGTKKIGFAIPIKVFLETFNVNFE